MAMRKRRRWFEVFSISFLDAIACGFGAVVLLLIVSLNADHAPAGAPPEIDALLDSTAKVRAEVETLKERVARKKGTTAEARAEAARLEKRMSESKAAYEADRMEAQRLEHRMAKLVPPEKRLSAAATRTSRPSEKRDDEVGGIPVGSEYVIFVIDTSGSMQSIWDKVIERLDAVIDAHPKVRGFQIMNDNGTYLLPGYRGKWISDTPSRRRNVKSLLKTWSSFSNSSPVEGIEEALKRYAQPDRKLSVYVFGDEYTGGSYDEVLESLERHNRDPDTGRPLAEVHGLGFFAVAGTTNPSYLLTSERFSILMREIARRNRGTYLTVP